MGTASGVLAIGLAILAGAPDVMVGGQLGVSLSGAALAEPRSSLDRDPEGETPRPLLESVLGREIRTSGDHDAGRIIDVLVDESGHVQAVVIEFGGFLGIGTRKIAVDWSALRFDSRHRSVLLVEVTRDQLRIAPEYKPGEPTVVPRASN